MNNLKKGDKVIVVKNIPSVDGMLHEGTKAKIDIIVSDEGLRIVDETGKIWYVGTGDVEKI